MHTAPLLSTDISPVAFISDLKVLPSMRPVVSCCVAVRHPHEAFASEDGLDGAALRWSLTLQGFVGCYR